MLDFGLPKIGISGMNYCPMDAMLKLAAMSNVHIQAITKLQVTTLNIKMIQDSQLMEIL